jgi:hypothetical protein
VLLFTPDVDDAIDWFALTHDVQPIGNVAMWRREALPHAGGINEQPAKLLDTLTFICQQKNAAVLAARRRPGASR